MSASLLLRMQLHVKWWIRVNFLIMNFGVKLHVALNVRGKLQITFALSKTSRIFGLRVALDTALGLKIKLHVFLAIKTKLRIAFGLISESSCTPLVLELNPTHFSSGVIHFSIKPSDYNYLLTYLLTYLLICPCSRVLLEKLSGSQLVKKFQLFHGTRSFITAITRAHHLSLS